MPVATLMKVLMMTMMMMLVLMMMTMMRIDYGDDDDDDDDDGDDDDDEDDDVLTVVMLMMQKLVTMCYMALPCHSPVLIFARCPGHREEITACSHRCRSWTKLRARTSLATESRRH